MFIDDEDFEKLKDYDIKDYNGSIITTHEGQRMSVARLILNLKSCDGFVKFKDGNSYNLQKANIKNPSKLGDDQLVKLQGNTDLEKFEFAKSVIIPQQLKRVHIDNKRRYTDIKFNGENFIINGVEQETIILFENENIELEKDILLIRFYVDGNDYFWTATISGRGPKYTKYDDTSETKASAICESVYIDFAISYVFRKKDVDNWK